MDHFNYQGETLFAESVSVATLAETYGTPCFVYSRATLERHLRAYQEALSGVSGLVCFAVKANSNLAVLNVLARLGAGFDIVSGGELKRVVAAGGDPGKVIFSGQAKPSGKSSRPSRQGFIVSTLNLNPNLKESAMLPEPTGLKRLSLSESIQTSMLSPIPISQPDF